MAMIEPVRQKIEDIGLLLVVAVGLPVTALILWLWRRKSKGD